jgi:hypothetical protein
MVAPVLGIQMYLIEDAVTTYGPQKAIDIPNTQPYPDEWRLVIGTLGGGIGSDVRNQQMRGGSQPPGQPREERTFSIRADSVRRRPSPKDRLVEKATGKNWQIVHVGQRYDNNAVIYYPLTIRELQP